MFPSKNKHMFLCFDNEDDEAMDLELTSPYGRGEIGATCIIFSNTKPCFARRTHRMLTAAKMYIYI